MLTNGRVRLEDEGDEAVASASAVSALQLLGSLLTGLDDVLVVRPLAVANWTGPLAARNCL